MNEMSVTFEVFFLFFLSWVAADSPEKSSSLLLCVCEVGDKTGCSIWKERELRVSASSISSVCPSFQRPSPENKPSVSTKVGIWGFVSQNTSTSFLRAPWTCSSRDILGAPVQERLEVLMAPKRALPTVHLESTAYDPLSKLHLILLISSFAFGTFTPVFLFWSLLFLKKILC